MLLLTWPGKLGKPSGGSWDSTVPTWRASCGQGRFNLSMSQGNLMKVVSWARGIAIVGVHPLLITYNVPILSTDLSAVRPTAQNAPGWDLFNVQNSRPCFMIRTQPELLAFCWRQTKLELIVSRTTLRYCQDLNLEKGYFTDFSPEMIIGRYMKINSAN